MMKDLLALPVSNGEQGRLHSPPTLFSGTLRPSLSGHLSCDPASQWLKVFWS
ncbi:rCG63382 [Rattus norvegicus]|uniref:RCG63382 n=1 Tax=Rattus norvegicus TaxID=10116 RepID=A6IJG5_RAT|nr:rCG63382 [Rattus norvegicus]